jgi:hypothetical protein
MPFFARDRTVSRLRPCGDPPDPASTITLPALWSQHREAIAANLPRFNMSMPAIVASGRAAPHMPLTAMPEAKLAPTGESPA